ncbi:MAG: hypothetical protein P4M11_04100 [Candidatus Pacebacteria bacterium]|nr:hypothetical protein [Candidatus Paceibacterota bacterium]
MTENSTSEDSAEEWARRGIKRLKLSEGHDRQGSFGAESEEFEGVAESAISRWTSEGDKTLEGDPSPIPSAVFLPLSEPVAAAAITNPVVAGVQKNVPMFSIGINKKTQHVRKEADLFVEKRKPRRSLFYVA